MVHVLHLTTWHPCIDGSSGVFVTEQCAALQRHGIQTGLIFSRLAGLRGLPLRSAVRAAPGFVRTTEPVPTIGFKSAAIPGMRSLAEPFNTWMLQQQFAAYVRRYGMPDLIHGHVALETGRALRLLSAKNNIGYVLTEHSSEILNGNLSEERRAAARLAYIHARDVLVVSSALERSVARIAPDAHLRVVSNLVADAVFSRRQPKHAGRSPVRLATLSSLVPDKRVDWALQAVARLPAGPDGVPELVVIGDGPERARLEVLAKRLGVRATFRGNLPHPAAMAELADADALLHPSRYETFGVVVVEAMALGLAVIATESGGPNSVVTAENGILVANDDFTSFVTAVSRLVSSISEWRARSGDIAGRARELFHESVVARQIAKSYA